MANTINNHGAAHASIQAFNTSDIGVYAYVLEILDPDTEFTVSVKRENKASSPVLFGGSASIFESGTTTLEAIHEDERFEVDLGLFNGRLEDDGIVEYSIIEIVFNTTAATTTLIPEFAYDEYTTLVYGVNQTTPSVRELMYGPISIRQGM